MRALRTERTGSIVVLTARMLLLVTLGYWAFGKAFAYLGLYPLYIGEVSLALGLLYLIHRGTIPVPNHLLFWVYWAFLIVVVIQSAYSFLVLGQPPLEVVRNMAVVYYGLFAIITYAVIARLSDTESTYRRLLEEILPRAAPWVLLFATISMVGYIYFGSSLPEFPKADLVSILFYKPTDAVVPLIVFMALWLRGYLRTRWMIWAAGLLAVAAARSRSAMLAIGAALLMLLWRPNKRALHFIAGGLLLFSFLLITDIRVDLGYREVSARQFLANVTSVIGSDEAASDLDATTTQNKSWRAAWWDAIYSDAVDNSRYLIGLGWGTNLADEFGFQTVSSNVNALRNPHNAFLGILARGGWLAAGLWVGFYLLLAYGLWQAARKFRDDPARRDMASIALVYVVVSQINGATDVFLESPQNAIPHWIVVGVGWALVAEAQRLSRPQAAPATHRTVSFNPVAGPRPVRPVLPVYAGAVRCQVACPHLGLRHDPSTRGMAPRPDHVCALHARHGLSPDRQEQHCLGDFAACPLYRERRPLEPSPQPEREIAWQSVS